MSSADFKRSAHATSTVDRTATAPRPSTALPPLEVDSTCLLQGQRELRIHHQGQCYRLQATRQGKLILTK